jgi:succinate dehydrogenase / fumarate reductase cytochrome b subunit
MSKRTIMDAMPKSPHIAIYRWRPPMVASLAHRASGLLLLVFALFLLCVVVIAHNGDADAYRALQQWLHHPVGYLFLLLSGTAVIYHSINGLRFLLLDLGVGESRQQMRLSAKLSIASAVAGLLWMAVWL